MPVFYYHPQNAVSKKLAEITNSKGFLYVNRGELELKIQKLVVEAGYDLWPTFHTVLGSLAGTIDKHLPMNPDDELDRHTLKLCNSSKTPWSYVKVLNGPNMSCVIGYCSTPASSPYALSNSEMARRGIIAVSHMPTAQ